jgi:6-phosphofructo-2-kinase/fructose-2,6-biphosphatase
VSKFWLAVDLADILEFKFVLKPVDKECEGVFEEGPNRILKAGVMSGGSGPIAIFKLPKEYGVQTLELPASVVTDLVSPFALAASWRALKKNIKPHGVRVLGIPDVSLDQVGIINFLF